MTMQSRSAREKLTRWMIGFAAAAVVTVAATARAGDEKGVGEANAQFYAALNAMFTGDVAPMKAVWSHREDVTYMGPGGGLEVGWAPVLALWEKQAAMKLGGSVKPTQTHITVGSDLAVVSTVEQGENTNADGKTEKVSIRATNSFRKENGSWKMIGHHTDLLPYLEASLQVGSAP
jgi:ketosteroid isomerase-like protein